MQIHKKNKWRRYRNVKINGDSYFIFHERFFDRLNTSFYITRLFKHDLNTPEEVILFKFNSKNSTEMYASTIDKLDSSYNGDFEIGDDIDY